MIEIGKLTKNDIGRWVKYTPKFGDIEQGRIKSWNEHYIFVVYKCDDDWINYQNYTGNATRPDDLNW